MRKSKTQERIRDVRKQTFLRRKKKLKIILSIILVVLLVVGTITLKKLSIKFLKNMEIFYIKNINVIPKYESSINSGLLEMEIGKNLLFRDINDLREVIVENQQVEDCKIKKIFPNTLQIEVVVRKPWMFILDNGNLFCVDRKGKVVYPIKEGFSSFSIIENVSIENQEVTEKDLWKLNTIKEIENAYNCNNLKKYITPDKIIFLRNQEMVIYSDGRRILIAKEDIAEKFKLLKIVFNEIEKNQQNWEYVDIRFEDPIVR